MVVQRVLAVIHNWAAHMSDVMVAGELIPATLNHRFWVDSVKEWRIARELKGGMSVRLWDGSLAMIESVTTRGHPGQRTYNLTVEGCHNYFVGAAGVLVHNEGEANFLVYFGYAPTDTKFLTPIYVGKTDDIVGRETKHRAQALKYPQHAYKEGLILRAQIDSLTEVQAIYHEAALYHQMADAGHNWGNLQEPLTKAKMNALAAAHC